MIRTIGVTENNKLIFDFPLQRLHTHTFKWYWVDFDNPTDEETTLLQSFFHFHPLAVEDCLQRLQRPKLNHFEDFTFLILHSIRNEDLKPEELAMFLGANYIVTFHYPHFQALEIAREIVSQHSEHPVLGHIFLAHQIIDTIVDDYFPILYNLEEQLNEIEEQLSPSTVHLSMDAVFIVRGNLLRLRRTIIPMRELIYRLLASEKLALSTSASTYFSDIHDNLSHLVAALEINREITADIRDSQLSINSNQMNRIMMTLTIVSSIFIPLTFIAGLYGMNFVFMPELKWRYGYAIVLGVMLIIGFAMLIFFKCKGWLRIFNS